MRNVDGERRPPTPNSTLQTESIERYAPDINKLEILNSKSPKYVGCGSLRSCF